MLQHEDNIQAANQNSPLFCEKLLYPNVTESGICNSISCRLLYICNSFSPIFLVLNPSRL